MQEKAYKYIKEVLGNLGWALTEELQPFREDQCWFKTWFIFIYQKITVTSQNCLQKELENEMSTKLHKSAKIYYEMANLLRLEAFLFIQCTPNSPPKLKERGCLKLKITVALLDLLSCPLESSLWAFVLRAADGELEEGVINEGDMPLIIP